MADRRADEVVVGERASSATWILKVDVGDDDSVEVGLVGRQVRDQTRIPGVGDEAVDDQSRAGGPAEEDDLAIGEVGEERGRFGGVIGGIGRWSGSTLACISLLSGVWDPVDDQSAGV